LKQKYNEQILINPTYQSSIFRSQVIYIQSSDEFDSILTADMFENTFITHLTLGYSYNQPTDHLPSLITYLKYGLAYTLHPIAFCNLPPFVTHLSLGKY
jgi:hypothetical protein